MSAAEAAFDAATRRLKETIVEWIRAGGDVEVGATLNPAIVTIAASAGTLVRLAAEIGLSAPALRVVPETPKPIARRPKVAHKTQETPDDA